MTLQLPSQCASTSNCLSRSVPEIHLDVAGTLSSQPTTVSVQAARHVGGLLVERPPLERETRGSNLTFPLSTKTECDYLNGWIKNGRIRQNRTQNEPQRYSWSTQKKKKKKEEEDESGFSLVGSYRDLNPDTLTAALLEARRVRASVGTDWCHVIILWVR